MSAAPFAFESDRLSHHLAELNALSADDLLFGAIQIDKQGTVLLYNDAESRLSGLAREKVIGKNFFVDIAPCTNNDEFRGAFEQGLQSGELNESFLYRFFSEHVKAIDVRVRMRKAINGTYWILVRPVGGDL